MTVFDRVALAELERRTAASRTLTWPDRRYENDLEGFARDILGIRMWSKQRELAAALQSASRVAVKAGQKVSKTNTLAIRALHHFCTYADARVYAMAPTDAQVKDPMWREISRLYKRSGICVDCVDAGVTERPCPHSACVDGKLNVSHRTGLVAGDRIVSGLATRFANNVSGKSGRLLWLLDECPGIDDDVFEAVQGTMAGGAWIVLTGNPTEPTGEFFDAFHAKKHLYSTVTISSYASPNVTEECEIFGLATPEWIEEKKQDWGEDSQAFQSRVLGEFAKRGASQMLGTEEIRRANARWEMLDGATGECAIGVDVAGGSVGGDKWIFAPRRGRKCLALREFEGLDAADGVMHLESLLLEFFDPDVVVTVNYDSSGFYGSEFAKALADWDRKHPGRIARRGIVPHADGPGRFDRLRDSLLANLAALIALPSANPEAIGIPADEDLESELLALKWDFDRSTRGQDKVIDKKLIRKQLGRSPDKCDALSYAFHQPGIVEAGVRVATPLETTAARAAMRAGTAKGSPYRAAAHDPWKNLR